MEFTALPSNRDTITALRVIARELGVDCAWSQDGAFVFEVSDGWLLRVCPDSADRFRLSACYGATEICSLWSRARDLRRLAALARDLSVAAQAV